MTDRLRNPDAGPEGRIPPSRDGKLPLWGVLARSGGRDRRAALGIECFMKHFMKQQLKNLPKMNPWLCVNRRKRKGYEEKD